jgi:putative flippase GtrA
MDFQRLFRYLTTGGVTKVSDVVIFSFIFAFSGSILLSNSVSTLSSLAINFKLHSHFTFKLKGQSLKRTGLKFASVNCIFFLLDTTLIIIFSSWLGITEANSKVFSTVLLMPVGYILSKNYIFRSKSPIDDVSTHRIQSTLKL